LKWGIRGPLPENIEMATMRCQGKLLCAKMATARRE